MYIYMDAYISTVLSLDMLKCKSAHLGCIQVFWVTLGLWSPTSVSILTDLWLLTSTKHFHPHRCSSLDNLLFWDISLWWLCRKKNNPEDQQFVNKLRPAHLYYQKTNRCLYKMDFVMIVVTKCKQDDYCKRTDLSPENWQEFHSLVLDA